MFSVCLQKIVINSVRLVKIQKRTFSTKKIILTWKVICLINVGTYYYFTAQSSSGKERENHGVTIQFYGVLMRRWWFKIKVVDFKNSFFSHNIQSSTKIADLARFNLYRSMKPWPKFIASKYVVWPKVTTDLCKNSHKFTRRKNHIKIKKTKKQ